MRTSTTRRLAIAMACIAVLMLPTAAAAAPGYEGSELTLTVDDASKEPGEEVLLASAEGCEPGASCPTYFHEVSDHCPLVGAIR